MSDQQAATPHNPQLEERKLLLEQERLEIEKQRVSADMSFLHRHSGTLISAAVSFAAVVVSITQLWVAEIQKQREYEVTRQQKEKELSLATLESERRWRAEIGKFISDNKEVILRGSLDERTQMRDLMFAIFPSFIVDRAFEKLAITADPKAKVVWEQGRFAIANLIPNIGGVWSDLNSPSNTYQITQDGNNFQFTGLGMLSDGTRFVSSGSGTITDQLLKSNYDIKFNSGSKSKGSCSGTVSLDGTRIVSTCIDSLSGPYFITMIRP